MNIKKLFAVMSATALAASCFAITASAATKLTDVVYPTEDNAEINDAYYKIGALGFFMNGNWDEWCQSEWAGIADDGTIDMTYEINKVLADKTISGKGSLGMMGIMVCNLPEENYPYEVSVLEATFTKDDGTVIELETAKAVTEATKHPEGNFRIILRPTDDVDEASGEVKVKAAPELAGMDQEGGFNGGTLHIKVDFGKKAADDSSSQTDSSSNTDSSSTTDSGSKTDSSSTASSSSSTASTASTTSKAGTSTISKAATTGGAAGGSTSSAATSDATESSGTGAAAGIALAVGALAASAIVVSKKRR